MLVNRLLVAASLGSLASAATTHKVAVGSGGLKFDPSSLKADKGDTVEFDFTNVQHDVVQSSFENPCSPFSNGFSVPPQRSSSMTFTITVNDTNPIYFYCSVQNHCNSGMVGIINPADKSQSDFASAAQNAKLTSPSSNNPVGGILSNGPAPAPGNSSSSGSSGASSTSGSGSGSSSTGSAAGVTSTAGAVATAVPAALAVVVGAVAAYL